MNDDVRWKQRFQNFTMSMGYDTLKNPVLRKHIDRVGKTIYETGGDY